MKKKNKMGLHPVYLFATLLITSCGGGSGDNNKSLSVVGSITTEVEPNDTQLSAQAVITPVTIRGDGNADSDFQDYYSFTPDVTKTYTIRLGDMGATDFDLLIINSSSFSSEFAPIDAPFEGPTESLTQTLDAGVLYYILVEAWQGQGTYTVTIE